MQNYFAEQAFLEIFCQLKIVLLANSKIYKFAEMIF